MPLSSAAEAADAASPVGNLMEPKEIVEKLRMLREVTAFFFVGRALSNQNLCIRLLKSLLELRLFFRVFDY